MKRAIFGNFIIKEKRNLFFRRTTQAALIILLALLVGFSLTGCKKGGGGKSWKSLLNTAPVATDGNAIVDEDVTTDIILEATDDDGDALTFTLATSPANGTVTITDDAATYTPAANYNGSDSFTFTANDGAEDSAEATVSITINPVNDPPNLVSGIPDQEVNSASFPITVNLSSYFTEVDAGDSMTYSVTANSDDTTVGPAIGALAGSTLTLTFGARNSGRVDITVRATDGGALFYQDTFAVKFPFLYSSGADWNDYVKNDGGDIFSATDTACNAATDGPGYDACIHGGETRTFDSGDTTACGSLSAGDALAAFDWSCANSGPGGTAVFTSTGLAAGKNLSDLIDFATPAWKPNQLIVTGGAGYTSVPLEWWENPLVVDNDGMASGAVARTIYLVTANPNAIYVIDSSKVGLVVQPGVTLNGPGTSADLISVTGRNFTWSEGMLDVTGDNNGVLWTNVKFSVLRGVSANNGFLNGIIIGNSVNNKVSGITVTNNNIGMVLQNSANDNTLSGINAANNGNDGVKLNSSSNNTLSKISAANNVNDGVNLNASTNNRLSEISAANNSASGVGIVNTSDNNTFSSINSANNGTDGVHFNNSWNNTLSEISAANNGSYGVNLNNSSKNNTLSGITASNNGIDGVFLEVSSNNNTLTSITAANNGQSGVVLINFSSNNTLSDVSAANNGTWGVFLSDSSDNFFTGSLKLGNNFSGDCYELNGIAPGLVDGTCDINGTSNFTRILGINLTNSFVGKVMVDDLANASDTNGGVASFPDPTLFDWTSFDNIYSGWGKEDANPFPHVNHRGRWTGGAGRIWDWSLATGDTGDGGGAVNLNVLTLPTGNDTLTHTWSDASVTTMLRNAVELSGDGIGNDNLLCEPNEACLYTPNMGAYQGHGNLVSAGAFTPGTLTGITLSKYEANGY